MTTSYPTSNDPVAIMQSYLAATWIGIPADKDMPPGMAVTLEMIEGQAVITSAVLKGDQGEKGDPGRIVDLQWPPKATAAELPTNLTTADENKGWWVGDPIPDRVYVWTGTTYEVVRPGPPGPAGPRPQITPECEVIPMEERTPDSVSEVIVTNDGAFPHWKFRLLAPQGPVGPSTNITGAPDYDGQGRPKEPGQVLTVLPNGKFGASDFAAKHPRFYSIPEGMFSPFSGPAQRHTILQYTIEPQDYDWVPYVSGHFRAYGIEIDADPLIIGSEVRLGDPLSGTLIARGFGNNSTWTTVLPHFSSTGNTTAAVAPDNGHAMVPAGQPAQISVNLYNDGLLGVYLFNPAGAQLDVLVIPQG